jgi:hypothetical protein
MKHEVHIHLSHQSVSKDTVTPVAAQLPFLSVVFRIWSAGPEKTWRLQRRLVDR